MNKKISKKKKLVFTRFVSFFFILLPGDFFIAIYLSIWTEIDR